MFKEEVTFRYKYEYDSMNLKDFIGARYAGERGDAWVEEIFPERVQLNGRKVNDDTIISPGDHLEYLHLRSDEAEHSFQPEVIFEDEFIMAVVKPDSIPVSPSGRYYFNSVAIKMKEWSKNEEMTPLHRLDLETSGVLLFGKTRRARKRIQPLFDRKKIDKYYQAVVFNQLEAQEISGNIVPEENSRIYTKCKLLPSDEPTSITYIEKIEPLDKFQRVWLKPLTGKTNQLRIHLASKGCPIVGDKKYYPDEEVYLDWIDHRNIDRIIDRLILPRQALHCWKMAFFNPLTEETVTLEDTSDYWEKKIAPLRSS